MHASQNIQIRTVLQCGIFALSNALYVLEACGAARFGTHAFPRSLLIPGLRFCKEEGGGIHGSQIAYAPNAMRTEARQCFGPENKENAKNKGCSNCWS